MFGEPPKILGIDIAGVIEEVGPDVKGYKKGDRMYFSLSLAPLSRLPQQNPPIPYIQKRRCDRI